MLMESSITGGITLPVLYELLILFRHSDIYKYFWF